MTVIKTIHLLQYLSHSIHWILVVKNKEYDYWFTTSYLEEKKLKLSYAFCSVYQQYIHEGCEILNIHVSLGCQ